MNSFHIYSSNRRIRRYNFIINKFFLNATQRPKSKEKIILTITIDNVCLGYIVIIVRISQHCGSPYQIVHLNISWVSTPVFRRLAPSSISRRGEGEDRECEERQGVYEGGGRGTGFTSFTFISFIVKISNLIFSLNQSL